MEIKYRQPIRDMEGRFIEWWYWGCIYNADLKVDEWITWAQHQNGLDTRKESQQFTGLKDKNGVEIYEQHIIIAPPTEHFPYKRKGIIMIAAYGIYFKPIDNTVGDYICKYSPTFIMNSEIIGNIYENQELLK